MFNFDGQLVVGAMQAQQAGDVITEILQHRRDMKAENLLQHQQSADQQRYAWLVAKYNDLADRYNRVLADNKRVDAANASAFAEKDRQIAQLIAQNAQLTQDIKEANESAMRGWSAVANIRDGIERHKIKIGDAWPSDLKPISEF